MLDRVVLSSGRFSVMLFIDIQVILNYQRRSVVGLSVDFLVLNVHCQMDSANR